VEPRTFFGRLARWVLRHRKAVAIGYLLLTVVSLGFASTLTVDSDVLNLMPETDPASQNLKALNDAESGLNLVSVAVAGNPQDTRAFLLKLQAELEQHPEFVNYAVYDVDDELALRLGLAHVETQTLVEMRNRLNSAVASGKTMANPIVASRLLSLGPMTEQLNLADERTSLLSQASQQEEGLPNLERIVIQPSGPAPDLPFCRAFMEYLDQTLADLDPESHGVEVVWIGGAYKYNVDDVEGIMGDMRWTAGLSVVLVLVLLLGALRDARVLPILFTPLLVGTAFTFGFAALVIGSLNSYTAIFGAVLVGLGIDFAIHLYSRYREERGNSACLEDAIVRAWDQTGPPCAAAGVTSVGGFMGLLLAQFKGFSQLGVLLAFGVSACLVSVLMLMPVLIAWREKQPRAWRPRTLAISRLKARPPTYRFAPVALLGLLAISAIFGVIARNLAMEKDLSVLKREGMAYDELSDRDRALVQLTYAAIIADYPDSDSLRAGALELRALRDSGEADQLGRIISVHDILPVEQERRFELLREIQALSQDENYIYLPAPLKQNLAALDGANLTPVTVEQLPKGVQHMVGADEDHHRLLVFPAGNIWNLDKVAELKRQAESYFESRGIPAAGEYLVVGSLSRILQRDAPVVGAGAVILVWLGTVGQALPSLLKKGQRLTAIRRSLGAMVVLALGMTWGAGALVIARVDLTVLNLVGIPILLGIGVDVVIHLLHRLAEEGPGRVMKALSTTGWASGLSAATTILSFLSLTFAANRGVESLGMLVVVGLSAVTLAGFFIVPIGWMTTWKLGGATPQDAEQERVDAPE
jgi:predicted RND superfamily exporter protein